MSPRLTPGIAAWLRHLAAVGTANRPKSNVGYKAMTRGLTEWVMRKDGQLIGYAEFHRRFPPDEHTNRWDGWESAGEQLTDDGRKALALHEQSENAADPKAPPIHKGRDEARAKGKAIPQAGVRSHRVYLH